MQTLNNVLSRLFPAEFQVVVERCEVEADHVSLHLSSYAAEQPCPRCQVLSHSIHSRYTRQFQHLPWGYLSVRIQLQVRWFRCRNCHPVRTFAERFPELVTPYARYSTAVCRLFRQFVLAVGGEGGKKLLASLSLRVSGDRLLTGQRRICPLPGPVPQVVGIDDFAFKKGLRYGTIIVDLETRQAIDLLPDRKAETVTQWLLQRPEIEVISQDRSTEYERASREGEARQACYERRCHEVAQIKLLATQGQSAPQIARDLHRSHHFVRFSLRVEQLPSTRHPPQKSKLDPCCGRLWELWQAGERNAVALLR